MSEYQDKVEEQKNRLWPRISRILQNLQRHAESRGYQVGNIADMGDEEFRWDFAIHPVHAEDVDRWTEESLGVSFQIMESTVHEGDESGINFRLQLQGDGGKEYCAVAPFNFTPQCWVPFVDAELDERLSLVGSNALEAMDMAFDEHPHKPKDTGNADSLHSPDVDN
jgi:hypothetical protein